MTPLPVDHYHAFLDPVVFVALGLIAAAVWRGRERAESGSAIEGVAGDDGNGDARNAAAADARAAGAPVLVRITLVAALAGLAVWNVATWPPAVARDGAGRRLGWPGSGSSWPPATGPSS